MSRTFRAVCGVAFGVLLAVAPGLAHRSFAARYDRNKPVTLRGPVTNLAWMLDSSLADPMPRAPAASVFAEVDVIAEDEAGRAVDGLRQEDFELREEGRTVPILTVEEMPVARGGNCTRSIVLVLDDITVLPSGTIGMRNIARLFLSRANDTDQVAVLRLSHPDDEPFGNTRDTLFRVEQYVGGQYLVGPSPFWLLDAVETWLTMVTNVSVQLEQAEGCRKAIIGIGSPAVLDPAEPGDHSKNGLWPHWVNAIAGAARSNVAVYVIDPTLDTWGIARLPADGLAEHTGGVRFTTMVLKPVVDQIWREAGHYYMLSYLPQASDRRLRSIRVTINRRGVHARVRRARGD